jgi:apolipoprotein N-acyltransferase
MAKMTAKRSGTTNLIGSLDIVRDGENERSYNSAFQLSPKGQIDQVYHKIKLVPFSERSPYQKYLPFLTRDFLSKYLEAIRTHQVQWWSNFYAGDSIILFDVNGVKYSTLICYEAAFPEYVREGVLKGASFIVNITNDTWFGRTIGPYQHMRITVMRAVENRIWLARCANSGISAVIDPYGREMVSAGLYERNILVHGLQLREDLSIFTRYGSFVGKFSFWILLIVLFIRLAIKIYNYFNRGTAKSFRVINRLRKRH